MFENRNPYIAGNPVTGAEMFFGRMDVFDFIKRSLYQNHVIVLYGQRRTGKTSVLYQMRRNLGANYVSIFIDVHGLGLNGLSGFIQDLTIHIRRGLNKDYGIQIPPIDIDQFNSNPRSYFEDVFFNQLIEQLGERHLLLMLDEAGRLEEQVIAGKLEKEVFEYLRHLMQHLPKVNFLFSLGSDLEEMKKEYALLFNMALYKKISFLDQQDAINLITEPVKGDYKYRTETVDHILGITNGHPYYTQLICHSLYNYCQKNSISTVEIKDVDAIVDETIELGLSVLKFEWDESSPVEKAILAFLAAVHAPVPQESIRQAWAARAIHLSDRNLVFALQSLKSRDVITGDDRYAFAVGLQRYWVEKNHKMEWVTQELLDWLQTQSHPPLDTTNGTNNVQVSEPIVGKPKTNSPILSKKFAYSIVAGLLIGLTIYFGMATFAPNKGVILNQLSYKCLDVRGAMGVDKEAHILLWDCEYFSSNTDQKWEITQDGFIRNALSGFCIDVIGAPGRLDGSPLQLWDCEFNDPNTDQKWEITDDGFIRNALSRSCIDVPGGVGSKTGSRLQIHTCEYSVDITDQKWIFVRENPINYLGLLAKSYLRELMK